MSILNVYICCHDVSRKEKKEKVYEKRHKHIYIHISQYYWDMMRCYDAVKNIMDVEDMIETERGRRKFFPSSSIPLLPSLLYIAYDMNIFYYILSTRYASFFSSFTYFFCSTTIIIIIVIRTYTFVLYRYLNSYKK